MKHSSILSPEGNHFILLIVLSYFGSKIGSRKGVIIEFRAIEVPSCTGTLGWKRDPGWG